MLNFFSFFFFSVYYWPHTSSLRKLFHNNIYINYFKVPSNTNNIMQGSFLSFLFLLDNFMLGRGTLVVVFLLFSLAFLIHFAYYEINVLMDLINTHLNKKCLSVKCLNCNNGAEDLLGPFLWYPVKWDCYGSDRYFHWIITDV